MSDPQPLPPGTFVTMPGHPEPVMLGRAWRPNDLAITMPDTHGNLSTPTQYGEARRKIPTPITDVAKIHAELRKHPAKLWDAQKYIEKSLVMGADPEVFVAKENGALWPAWEFLNSKKEKGQTSSYWDGFQAEYTIPATWCHQSVVWYLMHYMAELYAKAYKLPLNLNRVAASFVNPFTIIPRSVVEVPPHILASAPLEYVQFGCNPSHNVYGDCGAPIGDPRSIPIRFAGGHLHFEIPHLKNSPAQIELVVRLLDMIVGVCGVALADQFDDPRRRLFYGRAGEFRLPEHGLEYRVLSNFWLFAPPISHLVLDLARKTASLGLLGANPLWKAEEQETRETINNHDVKRAREIIQRNEKLLLHMMPYNDKRKKEALQLMYNGIFSKFPDRNLWDNWKDCQPAQWQPKGE